MPKTTINNQELYYEVHGNGPTHVLILPGWGGSCSSWQDFLNTAQQDQNFTWVIFDQPGFGKSPEPTTPLNLDNYLQLTSEFRNWYQHHNNCRIRNLLIHSFGGRIAIKWLSRHHEHKFSTAVFTGCAGIPSKPNLKQKIGKQLAKLKKITPAKIYNPSRNFLYKLLRITDYNSQSVVMQETFKNIIQEDLTDYLSKINIPIDLLWGENDSYTPIWMGQKMAELIPQNNLTILPNVRHAVHQQAIPELLEHCRTTFINKNE